ncbi:substrate-binding periplasmic protein [Spartinivicinus ruber]|uniref:substrate-binding periplasmic protein n=1 Tax=Spartinivicinus ruber TaxID=2683272 RepID=UPI0013D2A635|nr:transporter substrate-binding domain-containing protein [Spartinivicinus ruber]
MIQTILLVVALVTSFNSIAGDVVRLAIGEWPPYHSVDLEYFGIGSRIMKEAFANEDIEVEYGFFPWARSLALVKSGKWDGSGVWYYSPKRARYALYSDPVLQSSYVFFHLHSYPFDWKTIDDLKGVIIGGVNGYSYGDVFDTAMDEGKLIVQLVPTDQQNIEKLLAKRVNISAFEINNAYYFLNRYFALQKNKLTYHPKILTTQALHLIISKRLKNSRRLIKSFNKGLQALKQSGKVDQYINEFRTKQIKLIR